MQDYIRTLRMLNSTGTSYLDNISYMYYLYDSLGRLTLQGESFFQSYRACAEQLAQWLRHHKYGLYFLQQAVWCDTYTYCQRKDHAHGSIYLYLRPCGQNKQSAA